MRSDLERLNAENKALREQIEEDKQMVQRHLKEVDKEHAKMMAWEKERLQEENKELQKKHAGLLELVNPTIKLMKSNPELFGGEARGTSSPMPPPIIRLAPMKDEVKEETLNLLRSLLVAPSRPCLLVESPSTALPGIVETEPSSSQTEGLCMALTGEQVQQMQQAEAVSLGSMTDLSGQELRDIYHTLVGKPTGQRHSPPFGTKQKLITEIKRISSISDAVHVAAHEPVAEAAPEPVAEAAPEAKPKPNYNHPNWPSPITKRFAKHLAKHSGLRNQDPKSIKTHQDALEYIAKRGNISVETLLGWTMSHFQSFSQPWTLVEGPSKFDRGTAPAKWWC
jgi:hypothetical protein